MPAACRNGCTPTSTSENRSSLLICGIAASIASTPQTCSDMVTLYGMNQNNVTSFGTPLQCGPFLEDTQWNVTVPNGFPFHMPNGQIVNGTGQTLQFVGLRPYSSPGCNATTGAGCPVDGIPMFS